MAIAVIVVIHQLFQNRINTTKRVIKEASDFDAFNNEAVLVNDNVIDNNVEETKVESKLDNIINNHIKETETVDDEMNNKTVTTLDNQLALRAGTYQSSRGNDAVDKVAMLYLDGNSDVARNHKGKKISDVFDDLVKGVNVSDGCIRVPS